MEKQKTLNISINDLRTLCYIHDSFDLFNENINALMESKLNKDILSNLEKLSKGKSIFGHKKLKKFYEENKNIIEIINEHSSINMFIRYNYDKHGNLNPDSSLIFFNQYIKENKGEINQILELLEKIEELGFDKLKYNENIDFADREYSLDICFRNNFDIVYLDNMTIIPNYQNDVVRYKTINSDYKIIVKTSLKDLSEHGRTIIINSLLFSPERLPKEITKTSTFNKILNLKEKQVENCTVIRNSVDLNVSVGDLCKQFNYTNNVISKLDNVENKKELTEVLLEIKESLDKLKNISSEYDDSISNNNSTITKGILQEEKQAYLKRRLYSSIHLD